MTPDLSVWEVGLWSRRAVRSLFSCADQSCAPLVSSRVQVPWPAHCSRQCSSGVLRGAAVSPISWPLSVTTWAPSPGRQLADDGVRARVTMVRLIDEELGMWRGRTCEGPRTSVCREMGKCTGQSLDSILLGK